MTTAESSASPSAKTITEQELEQCQRANQTGRQPVVFVHGLWLLPQAGTGGRPCSRSRAMWP